MAPGEPQRSSPISCSDYPTSFLSLTSFVFFSLDRLPLILLHPLPFFNCHLPYHIALQEGLTAYPHFCFLDLYVFLTVDLQEPNQDIHVSHPQNHF
uniref:Uncharacterized protein n=1 Tax=Arundo donax TaxID=35708 RepID=A0A0A9BNA6_ARUDO